MKRAIILATSAILTLPAHAVTVLTSIKPIQMIATELTEGVTKPDVLLQNNASPHDYALRPSDVKKVAAADLVIWYGHELEPFLEKVVTDKGNTLTISQIPGLSLRKFGSEHAHEHDGHHHGTHDPHFWLGFETVQQVATAIAHKLAEIDPEHAAIYTQNLNNFEIQLKATDAEIKQQLTPVQDKGYFVFHDAYGYFEEHYKLNQMGHFTVSPDRKPGAKTLIHIRRTLGTGDVSCVFSEPQFTPAVIESVMRGSNVNTGILDPLGSEIDVKSGSYFEFLQSLSNSFSQCLSEK